MKPKTASMIALSMMLICTLLTIKSIFFDDDIFMAMVGMSSAPVMYFAYRNPEMLMVTSFKEFEDMYDDIRDKKYLWGVPAYQVFMLIVIVYMWLT